MVKHCISGSSGPNGLHLSRLHHSNRCLTFVFGHIAIPIPAPRRQLSHPAPWKLENPPCFFATILYHLMLCYEVEHHLYGYIWQFFVAKSNYQRFVRRRQTFPTRNRQFCNPELTCWSAPGRWFGYEKWTHPSRTTNPWWGFRFSVRVYFDVFSIDCWFSH